MSKISICVNKILRNTLLILVVISFLGITNANEAQNHQQQTIDSISKNKAEGGKDKDKKKDKDNDKKKGKTEGGKDKDKKKDKDKDKKKGKTEGSKDKDKKKDKDKDKKKGKDKKKSSTEEQSAQHLLQYQLQNIFTTLEQIKDSNLDAQTKQALSTLKQDPKKFVAFIQSVENAAKSQASTSASSSANTAMNISNETSITARNVQHSNPYTFAKLLRDSKLASLTSDTARYYKMNNGGVWANTFGGANIIDGNNGSLYGISIGLDKQVSDSLLIGIYGTYSNATIKDTGAKNKTNNFQLGFYTSYKFAPSWEFNAKVYGQSAKTDSQSTLTTGIISADYTQKFFGASGNIGKILNPSEGFYLKPFVGLNYYYGYTPSYTEKGILAKQVRSISSNSLSLDVGAEFRNYINENSYLFITPKIEQYLTNNGDDYIANFVGATSTFSIENSDKNKTYGQVLVGGNMDINDSISLNAGIGVKHLLRGKVDSKDETYLSGNVGVKYKF